MKRIGMLCALGVLVVVPAALAAASGPSGKWQTKLSKSVLHGAVTGTRVVDFTPGKYTVVARCPGTGEHSFSVKGTTLTFKKISDTASCAGRTAVLTTHPLKKIG
ncbi:MAG TPA: hypothetical protein VHX88_10105 [Solirubrobacteraceae bacterium]|jgi:hypothetical protein|nr:hypothetical protein [Solirubrobacteraceae bacterium]